MKVKAGIEKYQRVRVKFPGDVVLMVPVLSVTPDEDEKAVYDLLDDYFALDQTRPTPSPSAYAEAEVAIVKAALGLIYEQPPEVRIRRDTFDEVFGALRWGRTNLGEESGAVNQNGDTSGQ